MRPRCYQPVPGETDFRPPVRSVSGRYAAKLAFDLIKTAAKLCKRRVRMHFD